MSHYAVILVVRSDEEPNQQAVGRIGPAERRRALREQAVEGRFDDDRVDQTYAQRPGALWRESYAATRRLEYST